MMQRFQIKLYPSSLWTLVFVLHFCIFLCCCFSCNYCVKASSVAFDSNVQNHPIRGRNVQQNVTTVTIPSSPPASIKNSIFTGSFTIVKANQLTNASFASIFIGNYTNGSIIDVQSFVPHKISLIVHTTRTNFTKVIFEYDGKNRTEYSAPYSISASTGNKYNPIPYLLTPVGSKRIVVTAYSNTTNIVGSMTLLFRTIDSSQSRPSARPTSSPIKSAPVPTSQPTHAPTRTPTSQPTLKPTLSPVSIQLDFLLNGTWKVTDYNASLTPRHEACFVMVGRRAVLLGGRGKRSPDIYNPITKNWTKGVPPPRDILLHHTQCVSVQNKVWLAAPWSGGYPNETNVPVLYVYDPFLNKWETKTALADPRRRGSTAVVAIGELIYIAFGTRGGHETGNFVTSLPYLDVYNTTSDTWTALPDASFPRDHTGAAVVNGRICVSGGRNGGELGWPTVVPTECYNITTGMWSIEANIVQPRAGAAYGTSCDGKLLMAGGEALGKAYKNFDMFDGTNWTRLADLNFAVHGTGLAVDCVCNAIYIASGNGKAGSGMELASVETFSLDHQPCLA
jgi:hypothetical protein